MIELDMRDGWVIVRLCNDVLVLSTCPCIRTLKRGQLWRRANAFGQRLAPEELRQPCRQAKGTPRP